MEICALKKSFYEDKPDRYDHERQVWHIDYDNFRDCTKETINCQMGYPGHYTVWTVYPIQSKKDSAGELYYKVRRRIFHSHFVHGKDQGRHVDHALPDFRYLHESAFNYNPKLKGKFVPRWLDEDSQ